MAWSDRIPLSYAYTAGVAGEAFLRGLSQGRLIASKCLRCGDVRLPPRTYCLLCHGRTVVEVRVDQFGTVAATSRPRAATGGEREEFCFVRFEGVSGGLVHRSLPTGGRRPRRSELVRPYFAKPGKREGSLLDLEGFRSAPPGDGRKRL